MKLKEIFDIVESDPKMFGENLKKVNSFGELCKLYEVYTNGRIHKFFKELVCKYNFSTEHWKIIPHNKKWNCVSTECPVCKTIFQTKSGGRGCSKTCSYKCSNTFFKSIRHTEKSKRKRIDSNKKHLISIGKIPRQSKLYKITCFACGKEKFTKNKNQKFCSNICSAGDRIHNIEYVEKLRNIMLERVRNGIHSGWKSRNIISYPEQFFMKVLNNNNIKYEHNKPFIKYFIDFALFDKMIALEIDGKQHLMEDRKQSDIAKNDILMKNGWKVYRIPWNEINTDKGKFLMKEKIDNFLDYYKKSSPESNPVT